MHCKFQPISHAFDKKYCNLGPDKISAWILKVKDQNSPFRKLNNFIIKQEFRTV